MPGDMACHHYQILNDRPYPASFYRVPHGMGRTDVLCRIVSGIQTEQKRLFRDPSACVNGLPEKFGRMLLAVLAPFAQLAVNEITFPAKISHHWGIPVASLVSTGNAFLFGFRIITGRYIHVNGDKATGDF